MTSLDYPEGPLRDAYRAGAQAEARAREGRYAAAGKPARDVLDLVKAIVEHSEPVTALDLLLPVLRITSAGQDRAGRRAMRRAIKKFRP